MSDLVDLRSRWRRTFRRHHRGRLDLCRLWREQGLRRIPRGSRSSTRTNLHGLTKREAEIFELLAQGLRNSAIAKRLFVTTKTVDHHVSAIFTKLGVSSRAEAIALASKKPAEG